MNFLKIKVKTCIPDKPEKNGTIRSTTSEQTLMNRVPCKATDLLLMATKCLHIRGHIANIEYFDQVITRSCQKPISVLIPFNIGHCILMCMSKDYIELISK